jgi:hypothetical protein
MPAVQLTVPTVGTKLTLTRGWSFTLRDERRNFKFIERLGLLDPKNHLVTGREQQFNLPAGTILTVSRIYIRQGNGDWDSITFSIKRGACPDKKIHGRFWAKLGDVNRIMCEWDMETVKQTEQDPVTALGDLSR